MRVTLNRWYSDSLPCNWAKDMTWGRAEQSNRNWKKSECTGLVNARRMSLRCGKVLAKLMVNLERAERICCNELQDSNICSSSS